MGWFKKKFDPISERARELKQQIAALESKIQKLSAEHAEAQAPAPPPTETQNHAAAHPQPQPRLRSTALPHGPTLSTQTAAPRTAPESLFEEIEQCPIQDARGTPKLEPDHELGVRKNDLAGSLQRLKNNFRGPASSNPKLVNYLAAGSIQGLRPLRYEKRVARNRFIVLVGLLVLLLWGIVAVFIRHR